MATKRLDKFIDFWALDLESDDIQAAAKRKIKKFYAKIKTVAGKTLTEKEILAVLMWSIGCKNSEIKTAIKWPCARVKKSFERNGRLGEIIEANRLETFIEENRLC